MSLNLNINVNLDNLLDVVKATIGATRQKYAQKTNDNKTKDNAKQLLKKKNKQDGLTFSGKAPTGFVGTSSKVSNQNAGTNSSLKTNSNGISGESGQVSQQKLSKQEEERRKIKNGTARRGGEFPITMGWDHYNYETGDATILSGDGSQSMVLYTSPTGIPSPIKYEGSYTSTGVLSNWYWQDNNSPYTSQMTPYPIDYWTRQLYINEAEFAYLFQYNATGGGGVTLPCDENGFIVAIYQPSIYVLDEYLLRASLIDPESLNISFSVIQEVEGGENDDPEQLLQNPNVRKRLRFLLDNSSTRNVEIVQQNHETYYYNRSNKAVFVSKSNLRSREVPGPLKSQLISLGGRPPTGILPTYEYTFFPYQWTRIQSKINGIEYYEAFIVSFDTINVEGFTYRNISEFDLIDKDQQKIDLLQQTPVSGMGFIRKEQNYSTFSAGTGATPFVYRALLGGVGAIERSYFYQDETFMYPRTIEEVHELLKPLPKQYAWIDGTPVGLNYFDTDTFWDFDEVFKFNTYLNNAGNVNPGDNWTLFGEATEGSPQVKPYIPGVPKELKLYKLSPNKWQKPFFETSSSIVNMILATPYGDSNYCRAKLFQLGFAYSDLQP